MRLEDALRERRLAVAGEHARVTGGWEIIGPPECPILGRRTLIEGRVGKVLWHRFFANSSDKDCHDHPRSFVTIVLRGGYDDVQPDGTTDRVRAPAIRYRHATHAHITKVGPRGATTLCLMGPVRREWGFWRIGQWLPWRDYERRYGLSFRCDPEPTPDNAPSTGASPVSPSVEEGAGPE